MKKSEDDKKALKVMQHTVLKVFVLLCLGSTGLSTILSHIMTVSYPYITIYLISVYYRNLMVSIADSCTFQRVAMWLIVDQSLATGFVPINTRQQSASLPFKPGVLERKVYNNDDKTYFSEF